MTSNEKIRLFFVITFLNIWWIALWGITYILIELLVGKNKMAELAVYVFMMLFVILVLAANPDLIPHL